MKRGDMERRMTDEVGRGRSRGWYHGWNVVGACVVAQVSSLGLTINCFSLFIPHWSAEFDVPVSTLALAITLFSFVTAFLSYQIGILASRYPARWLFGGGIALLAACHLLISQVGAGWEIIALYVLVLPFAISFTGSIPAQSLVSRWFAQKSGLAMGLTATGMTLAGVLFPPVIVHFLPLAGWRVIWAGMGVAMLAVTLPIALLAMRDRPDPDDPAIYARPPDGHAQAAPSAVTLAGIVRRRNFWVIMSAFLSVQLIALTVAVDIAPIIYSYGGTAGAAGLFLSIYSAGSIAAKLGSGWLADRIGNSVPLALTAVAGGTGAILLAVPDTHPLYLAGVAITLGLAGGAWTLLASSMLAEFGPVAFGRAFGLAATFSPLPTLAPPVVAWIHEASGSFALPLIGLGVLAFVAAGAVMAFYRAPGAAPAPVGTATPG
ncbi:MAG: MFS transporter [Novosphingobium sp.]|nr:MFS transporter [Novosphingobium sp.]